MNSKCTILFISSNSSVESSLLIEREIHKFQRNLPYISSRPYCDLVFLADVEIENFATYIREYQPDIIHFTAHGEEGLPYLKLKDQKDKSLEVSGKDIGDLFTGVHIPKFVYANGCHTSEFAKELSKIGIPVACYEGPVTNDAAIACAGNFYYLILRGEGLRKAVSASKILLRSISTSGSKFIYRNGDIDDQADSIFVKYPEVILKRDRPREPRNHKGYFRASPGLINAPNNLKFVIYFIDGTYFESASNGLGEEALLLSFANKMGEHGILFPKEKKFFKIWGNGSVNALILTADGEKYIVHAEIKDSLHRYYSIEADKYPQETKKIVESFKKSA